MKSTTFKFSLLVCVVIISISSCVNGGATLFHVDQTDNTSDGLKKRIEAVTVGLNSAPWVEWPHSRAGLEADGIVQALKHHFPGLFNPRQRNIPAQLTRREVDYNAETFAFVINNGGNSLDGILAAAFLWIEGKQIVGFHSRASTEGEKKEQKKLDADSLRDNLVKEIPGFASPEDKLALKTLIEKLLEENPMPEKKEEEKLTNGVEYYGPLVDKICVAVAAQFTIEEGEGSKRLKRSIATVLSIKWKKEKAGHIADGYVKSLLEMLKSLGVQIYEESEFPLQEHAAEFFDQYTNIVAAFDALNGAGKEHSAIFAKSYGGLAILKYLKSGINRYRNVIIIGVDMASFEDSLHVRNVDLDKSVEDGKIEQVLADKLKTDRDLRVVKSDIVVTINAYRKKQIPLMDHAVYYLVIPRPVQDLFNRFIIEKANVQGFTIPTSEFKPQASWITSDGDGRLAHKKMYKDISKLATYYKYLDTVLPEVY